MLDRDHAAVAVAADEVAERGHEHGQDRSEEGDEHVLFDFRSRRSRRCTASESTSAVRLRFVMSHDGEQAFELLSFLKTIISTITVVEVSVSTKRLIWSITAAFQSTRLPPSR